MRAKEMTGNPKETICRQKLMVLSADENYLEEPNYSCSLHLYSVLGVV